MQELSTRMTCRALRRTVKGCKSFSADSRRHLPFNIPPKRPLRSSPPALWESATIPFCAWTAAVCFLWCAMLSWAWFRTAHEGSYNLLGIIFLHYRRMDTTLWPHNLWIMTNSSCLPSARFSFNVTISHGWQISLLSVAPLSFPSGSYVWFLLDPSQVWSVTWGDDIHVCFYLSFSFWLCLHLLGYLLKCNNFSEFSTCQRFDCDGGGLERLSEWFMSLKMMWVSQTCPMVDGLSSR